MKEAVCGIDIGGTNTVAGLIDIKGNCIVKDSFPTQSYDDFETFAEVLAGMVSRLYEKVKDEWKMLGIGIGAPNGNYYTGTIELAPNLKWHGSVEVVKEFEKYFDIPIVLTNDANAAARGEMMYGGAIDMTDFIVITLGTGLGSGIVVNGEVVYGHDGFAGEIGHTIVDPEGRKCGCGRRGCLETYASATGIKRTVIELIETTDTPSVLRDIPFEKLSGKDFDNAAREGDRLALEAFEYTGKILGLKLSDAVAHTSPEAIFLYGGLANAGDLILKPTEKYMNHYLLPIYRNKVKLLQSSIYDTNAAILGAAALMWKELENKYNKSLL
ncbi:MAG: ROK family protein [Bacteroidota bacterium]